MASIGFQYTPLDKTKSQTRLLEIIPQSDSSLQYSLTTFDLATIPRYIALSYTWGNDEPSHTIFVDGQAFKVRDNLSCALPFLANLRRTGDQSEFRRDERYFWIDAICIDQQDIKERNHQVAMMKDIFTTASLTVAWLGPENEDFQILNTVDLQLRKSLKSRASDARIMRRKRILRLRELRDLQDDDLEWPPESPTFFDRQFSSDEDDGENDNDNAKELSKEDKEKLWHPIKLLFENIACKEYFTRMWIIQEILLSRELWVMCGNGICTWRTLEEYWVYCFDISDDYDDRLVVETEVLRFMNSVSKETGNPMRALHTAMASRLVRDQQPFFLEDLVHLYHDRKCKDPLDRIYALLGLLSPQALLSSPISVDYDVSPEDLFKLARKHCYTQKRKGSFDRYSGFGGRGINHARSLQMALGIEPIFRIQYEYVLIQEGVFRDH